MGLYINEHQLCLVSTSLLQICSITSPFFVLLADSLNLGSPLFREAQAEPLVCITLSLSKYV